MFTLIIFSHVVACSKQVKINVKENFLSIYYHAICYLVNIHTWKAQHDAHWLSAISNDPTTLA